MKLETILIVFASLIIGTIMGHFHGRSQVFEFQWSDALKVAIEKEGPG